MMGRCLNRGHTFTLRVLQAATPCFRNGASITAVMVGFLALALITAARSEVPVVEDVVGDGAAPDAGMDLASAPQGPTAARGTGPSNSRGWTPAGDNLLYMRIYSVP